MIADSWKIIQIKDICQLGRGRVINQDELYAHPGKYPVYSSQSKNGGAFGHLDTFNFEGEYVTWTTDGAYAGTVFYRAGRFNCTNVCGTLKAKTNEICMKYVAYALSLRTKKYVSYVGNPKLMNNIMGNIAFSMPSLPEQRRIAEILDTIDEAIQKTEALISKLKAMKQGLLHDLFTRGLDKNGKLRDPKAHPEQFKDSPFGLIPVDWDVVDLGVLSTLVTSGSRGWASLYSDQGALFLRIGNLTRDHVNLRLDDVRYVLPPPAAAEGKRTKVGEGDLLISITADLGIIGVIPDGLGEAYVNQHIALVRLNRKSANPYWVANYLAFGASQKQFYMLNDQGAKAGINLPTVESLLVAVPKFQEQDRIAALIAAHDALIRTEEQYRDKLKLQKKGLMHDLLTGKVRVKV